MAETTVEKQLLVKARQPTITCLLLMLLCLDCFSSALFTLQLDYAEGNTNIIDEFGLSLLFLFYISLVKSVMYLCWSRIWDMLKETCLKICVACFVLLVSCFALVSADTVFWSSFVTRLHDTIVSVHLLRYEDRLNIGPVDGGYENLWLNALDRYNTEDAKFTCWSETVISEQSLPIGATFEWFKDGRPLQITKHRRRTESGYVVRPQTEAESKSKTRPFYAVETLFLPFIDDDDFGDYQCRVTVASRWPFQSVDTMHPKWHGFRLKRIAEQWKDVPAPPQAVVHIHAMHISKDHDSGDFLVDHRIDGVPLHYETEEDGSENCFSMLGLYNIFIKRRIMKEGHRPEHLQIPYHSRQTSIFGLYDIYSFCVGHKMFREYSVIVRKHFFNVATQTEDFVETEYPMKFQLVPSFPGIFGKVSDNVDTSFLDKCRKNHTYVTSDYCRGRRFALQRSIKIYGGLYAILYGLLVLVCIPLTIAYCYVLLKRTFIFLREGSFWPNHINTLCPVPLTHASGQYFSRTQDNENPDQHDVFLSYHSSDHEVCDRVRSLLERHQLRVFDCHRDVQPGSPSLLIWDRAISSSHSFVLILSPQYVVEPWLKLQFRAINFHMLSHEVPEERMLILVAQPCPISQELGPLPIIDLRQAKSSLQLQWWIRNICAPTQAGFSLRRVYLNLGKDLEQLFSRGKPLLAAQRLKKLENGESDNQRQPSPMHTGDVSGRKVQVINRCAFTHISPYQCIQETINGGHSPQNATPAIRETQAQDFTAANGSACSSSTGLPKTNSNTVTNEGSGSLVPETFINSSNNDINRSNENENETLGSERTGDCFILGGASYIPPQKPRYDVFLTYCEDSEYDSNLAEKVKAHLHHQRVRVFDANRDLLPGQEEVGLVAKAAACSAFVVVLSLEYCYHPITRRLHFPRVLQAVLSDRISPQHVLIIVSPGKASFMDDTVSRTKAGSPQHRENNLSKQEANFEEFLHSVPGSDGETPCCSHDCTAMKPAGTLKETDPNTTQTGDTSSHFQDECTTNSNRSLQAEVHDSLLNEEFTEAKEKDFHQENWNWELPACVKAFPHIYWSSNIGVDHQLRQVTRWARQVFRTVPENVEELRHQYLRHRAHQLHRPVDMFSYLRQFSL